MSWNEPGGGKKDPWSGQDQSGGPPDLEDFVRTLQEKISGIFGGGRGGPSDSSWMIWLVLVVALVLWLLSGIYIVQEGNRGVVTRFGKYTATTMPGLHWHIPVPVEAVEIVDIERQRFLELGYRSGGREQPLGSVPQEALMLTGDENIVDVRLAVQYSISSAKDFLFNIKGPEETLREVTESSLREIVGRHTMDFALTEGRSEIAAEVKSLIQSILDAYSAGIAISNVNLVDAQPPEEVQGAFEDAIKAREDKQRFINEAQAYANEVIPKSRGQAARILEEAQGYKQKIIAKAQGDASRFEQILTEYQKAPEINRTRMYLDALESVLGETDTVMVDVKGGNNLLYLPLDKLHGQLPGSSSKTGGQLTGPEAAQRMLQLRQPTLRRSDRGRAGRGR